MQFYQLAKGALFEFNGSQFTKTAMSMAEDSDHNGNIFQVETEVVPIGDPLLLPEEEAEKWKPSPIPRTAYILPAPGQLGIL